MDPFTLLNWETHKTKPPVYYWPRIMAFLGYCPYQQARTFGDRLRLHRMHRGFSYRALARILGIDPGMLSRWENAERKPTQRMRERLKQFMRTDVKANRPHIKQGGTGANLHLSTVTRIYT